MKKVWIGLSVACLGIGIVSGLTDVIKGDVTKDTGAVLFVMALFAAFFGYLAWLWRIKSPLKRAKEQIDAAADTVKKSNDAYKKLPKSLKQLFAAKAVSGKITLDNGYPITIDNMIFTACMLHRFEGGGFMFCPDADATDGILNLCVVGDLPKPIILMALPTAFSGSHYRFEGITPYQAKQVTIESSAPLWVHTDGEVTRKSSRITVSCRQQSIRILVP